MMLAWPRKESAFIWLDLTAAGFTMKVGYSNHDDRIGLQAIDTSKGNPGHQAASQTRLDLRAGKRVRRGASDCRSSSSRTLVQNDRLVVIPRYRIVHLGLSGVRNRTSWTPMLFHYSL